MTSPSRSPSDVTIATCSCCGQQMHPTDWKERMLFQLSQARDDALEEIIPLIRRYLQRDSQRPASWHEVEDCIAAIRKGAE